jgi:uncharacterized protein (TIGR03435 family)
MQTTRFIQLVPRPKVERFVTRLLGGFAVGAASFALLITVAPWAGSAQSNGPSFEAASIRPGVFQPPGPGGKVLMGFHGGPGTDDPENFSARNVTLAAVVMRAYALGNYQLSGPSWMERVRYDIAAKVAPGAAPAQFKLMLQSLLVDRFTLKFHYDKRVLSGYELSLAAGGLKLVNAVNSRNVSLPPKSAIAKATTAEGDGNINDIVLRKYVGRIFVGQSATITNLAHMLESTMGGVPVVDSTDLTDAYDFILPYDPPVVKLSDEPSSFPSIFTVLQAVGLKLEAKKMPLDVLVVDQIQQTATDN